MSQNVLLRFRATEYRSPNPFVELTRLSYGMTFSFVIFHWGVVERFTDAGTRPSPALDADESLIDDSPP